MTQSYKISSGKEYIILTIDDSGAYLIKDMKGSSVYLSKFQARIMKEKMARLFSKSKEELESKEVKVEKL